MTNEEYKKELTRYWDSIRAKDIETMGECNCGGVECDKCMFKTHFLCVYGSRSEIMSNAFEITELIEQWSKEHPIKTNGQVAKELLEEKFGIKINIFMGCNHIQANCGMLSCDGCKYKDFWEREYKER